MNHYKPNIEKISIIHSRLTDFLQTDILEKDTFHDKHTPSLCVLGKKGGRDIAVTFSKAYADFVGVPVIYAWLHDSLYFSMTTPARRKFIIDWLEKIPEGFDFANIEMKYYQWLLNNDFCGVVRFLDDDKHKNLLHQLNTMHHSELAQDGDIDKQWTEIIDAVDRLSGDSDSEQVFLLSQACTKLLDVDIYTINQLQDSLIDLKSAEILQSQQLTWPDEAYQDYQAFCDAFIAPAQSDKIIDLQALFRAANPVQSVILDDYQSQVAQAREQVALACAGFFYARYQSADRQ